MRWDRGVSREIKRLLILSSVMIVGLTTITDGQTNEISSSGEWMAFSSTFSPFRSKAGNADKNGPWVTIPSGTGSDLRGVFFITAQEGWVTGTNDILLRTTNGGGDWTEVMVNGLPSGKGFQCASFLDSTKGWVGGPQCVLNTRDGGANWRGKYWSTTTPVAYRLYAIDENNAWVVGRTTIGGMQAYWQKRYKYSADGSTLNESFWQSTSSSVLLDVVFVSADTGWTVGTNGKIIKITNAMGSTPGFETQTSGTEEGLRGIFMQDADTGWIVGTNGTILHTTNGGTTWTPQATKVAQDLDKVHFIDTQNGWAVGDGGVILTTTNGGGTWTAEASGTGNWLRWVHFADGSGYAVGHGGVILKRSGEVVETPPSITTHPQGSTICTGNSANLSVSASGTGPLHYQWYQGNSGDTSVSVGTDSDTFTTPALTATTSYWVRVSNSFGTADSNTATVTVVTEGGPCDQCSILIVTPDSSEKDISGVLDILNGFPDLAVTVWDNTTGTPGSGDLAPYSVVIIGNQNLWAPLGLDAASLGDALAVYIDNGGKVIESLYIQSFDLWGFNGDYLTGGYSPFTKASQDFFQEADLVIAKNGHPILDGVTAVHDNMGHQNPGLQTGATLLATWSGTGANAIAFNEDVVGLNMLIFNGADWTGDVPTLLYNSIKWLCTDSGPAKVSYLPHFAQQNSVWGTDLTLANATDSPQDVVLEAYDDQGSKGMVASAEHTLPANGGLSQPVGDYFPRLSTEIGWIKIRSYTENVKGIMKFSYLPADGTSSLPTVYWTTRKLIFPLMEVNAEWLGAFAVVNPQGTSSNCTARAYTYDGALLGSVDFQIPANGKYVGFLSPELFSLASLPERVILRVESGNEVTGFALLLKNDYTGIVAVPASSYGD